MKRDEADIAIEWAKKEGWNPGLNDAECYYSADPNGFFIGHLEGEPISTISAVSYGNSFGFMGFYIVKPEFRGKGYGIQIWNAGLKYLEGRNIGLDGVVEQQQNYEKSGFKLAYRNIRYKGICAVNPFDSSEIVNLTELPYESVESYDRSFFPADRSRFIKCWINQADSHALGIIRNDKLAGYGVIRQCYEGYKIGPLFADSPGVAESLFMALQSKAKPSEPIFMDIPEVNQDALFLVEQNNMQVVFETARMYKGKKPDIPLNRIFGVTSFEVG